MKKLFKLLLTMFVLYLLLQVGFRYFGKGYTVDYEVAIDEEKRAQIHEVYTNRVKGEKKNYFFNIQINNQVFPIQTYQGFNYSSRVIKKIKYYQGNYTCIYPIFKKHKQLTDVICKDQGILKNYQDLKGKDEGLDSFVNKLIEEKVYTNNFQDNMEDPYTINSMTVYPNNVVKNHFLAVNNYNGLYTINLQNPRTLYEVKLLENDTYQRELTALSGLYYMTANYDEEYEFKHIKIVNITNNSDSDFELKTPISFNSYIQGVVDNEVYLVDKSNKKQYKINLKEKVVYEIGNETTNTKYYDRGTWSERSIYEVVNQEKYFNTNSYSIETKGYARSDKVGNERSGYIYYYKQNGNNYEVYRASVQTPTILNYIFTTSDISHVIYIDDYVYYYVGNCLKVYHDGIGNRTIYQNTEYEFNKTLNYYIYKK